MSGLLKLLYPHEDYDKEAVAECLEYALEVRRRIKEQLKRIGGMEFFEVHFSYIDLETNEEKFVMVLEQGGGSLIPESPLSPGALHTVARGSGGHLGLYRLETQVTTGTGQLKLSGFGSNTAAKESVKVGFDFFRANAKSNPGVCEAWRPRFPPARGGSSQYGALYNAYLGRVCGALFGAARQSC